VIARSHPKGPPGAGSPGRRWELSYAAWTWALTEAEFQSIQDGLVSHPPDGIAFRGLKGAELVQRLRDKLSKPGLDEDKLNQPGLEEDKLGEPDLDEEERRGQLTWELERAENFERLERLRQWWKCDHRPGDAVSPPKGGPR
jgi:hypothetical protein